jgi:GTP-binding protein EngB required for normal cell division
MNPSLPLRLAVVGHPNEGKSSVVSTLAEDDTVPVSPFPGETRSCRAYPVSVDGRTIVEFIDTPGFQNPRYTLEWLEQSGVQEEEAVRAFRAAHQDRPAFRHEFELLQPIESGAGIIYVVDGSRPLRRDDRAEMEILRRTGRPRLALINLKDRDERYLEEWKGAFRRHFNAVRVFNAHSATYAERIALLEALRNIDQDWQPAMDQVIAAFRRDWQQRLARSADLIADLLESSLRHVATADYDEPDRDAAEERLKERFCRDLGQLEQDFHQRIRRLFKHNIFDYQPPPDSALRENLFSERVWKVLGLDRAQLTWAAALAGGAAGAGLDVAFTGITAGVFTAAGALLGAVTAYFGGGSLARLKRRGPRLFGIPLLPRLGKTELKIGPLHNLQFFFVLIDRALIFFSYVIHWAHGRRDPVAGENGREAREGYTADWSEAERRTAVRYFETLKHPAAGEEPGTERREFQNLVRDVLTGLSGESPR